jgi:hypothetical protein
MVHTILYCTNDERIHQSYNQAQASHHLDSVVICIYNVPRHFTGIILHWLVERPVYFFPHTASCVRRVPLILMHPAHPVLQTEHQHPIGESTKVCLLNNITALS